MPLPRAWLLVLVAVVASLFVRRRPRALHAVTHSAVPHVLLACPPDARWHDRVTAVLTTATHAVRVSVLLVTHTTSSASSVPSSVADAYTASFRGAPVHVELAAARSSAAAHPWRLVRRLCRRFLLGDEHTAVVLTHPSARLVQAWDALAVDLVSAYSASGGASGGASAVISAPVANRKGVAQFPALRERSNGSIARDTSIPFVCDSATTHAACVATTCWCAEVTCGTGACLLAWTQQKQLKTTASYVEVTDAVPSLVPTTPFLLHDADMEDDTLDHDEGKQGRELHAAEIAGLTHGATPEERVAKYGSLHAAAVAVRAVAAQRRKAASTLPDA